MVIPTFSSFAPKPDLAQSFLGGQRVALAAQQAQAELEVQRARLQQAKVQAEMEHQLKEKALQQDNLRHMTELSIEAAYKEAVLGLHQRQLETTASLTAQKIAEAQAHNRAEEALSANRTDVLGQLGAGRLQESAAHHAAMEAVYGGRLNEMTRHHGELEGFNADRLAEMTRHHGATEDISSARNAFMPTTMDVGGKQMYQTTPGNWHFAPQERTGAIEPSVIAALRAETSSLRAQLGKSKSMKVLDPEGYKALQDRLAAKQSELDSHLARYGAAAVSAGPTIPSSVTNAPVKSGRFTILPNTPQPQPTDEEDEDNLFNEEE